MAHMMPPGPPMLPPDQGPNPHLVRKIVQELKINGVFDEMRRECAADIDTKPAFQNLKQRVEGHVNGILSNQEWTPSLNKNQLRSNIRQSVMQSGILNEGVDRILHQMFSAKAYPIFFPRIQDFVRDNRQELMKEFMPLPMEMPPMMMNPPPFVPPPMPVPPDMQPELLPPPMPSQPPPPESPISSTPGEPPKVPESITPNSDIEPTEAETSEEILNFDDQEFYVKDVAPEDIVVKAINTPSPQHSTPESTEEGAPKIPEDAVNPLRSLIQSLLVSKNNILDSADPSDGVQGGDEKMEVEDREVKVEGHSPTIDPSQIEAFTDDEEGGQTLPGKEGPKTPTPQQDAYHSSASPHARTPTHAEGDNPDSPPNRPYTPTSLYSPLSPGHLPDDGSLNSDKNTPDVKMESEHRSDNDSRHAEDRNSPSYDPGQFSYQPMSDSTPVNEDHNDQSPPSPTDITDTTERSYTDDAMQLTEEKYDMRRENEKKMQRHRKDEKRRNSTTDSSDNSSSSSSGTLSSSSSEDENDQTVVVQEQIVVQEVEETVEEIEVVEEFTSGSEEGAEVKSESEESAKFESPKDKRKKKKSKKQKTKKAKTHKRSRSSSISSGEITSSGELSSDSSSDASRPTRPTGPPRPKLPLDLQELEERRRIHHEESMHDRPFWPNAASSSDYMSSPGRIRHPYSPPRRPYSPDFHRFENERNMSYGPPPAPHFRDRPMFPDEFRPIRHSRFSPPPYRRSPPHRYSPGPRMDYPRMPFGSPRSPPRRPYSPPHHMIGGYPGDPRPPFLPPRHRWGSPPHPGMGHRRPSRSPPPVMRRDDVPGPSRY